MKIDLDELMGKLESELPVSEMDASGFEKDVNLLIKAVQDEREMLALRLNQCARCIRDMGMEKSGWDWEMLADMAMNDSNAILGPSPAGGDK